MNEISLENVFFTYSEKEPVLQGIVLKIKPGEMYGLLGANGSGKTTTFKLLSGLLQPDEGHIAISGIDVIKSPREAQKICAYLPDDPLIYPQLSALENLNMFALLWGVNDKNKIKERAKFLLKEVGLWSVRHQLTNSYSRGMQQKLALCVALIHEPKILFMDEPFTGLDINAIIWARNLLKEYTTSGNTVLFTSHIPELMESLASKISILKNGVIIESKSVHYLKEDGQSVLDYYQKHI